MAECIECGATVATGESFCGGCGTQQLAIAESSPSAGVDQPSDHLTPVEETVAEEEAVAQVSEPDPEANRHTGQLSSEAEADSEQPADASGLRLIPRRYRPRLSVVLRPMM